MQQDVGKVVLKYASSIFYNQSLLKKAMLLIKSLQCNPRDIIQLPAGSLIKCLQLASNCYNFGLITVKSILLDRNTLTFIQRRLSYIPLAMNPC